MRDITQQLRHDYQGEGLTEAQLDADPLRQFQAWFAQAVEEESFEANAMTLATADETGAPSARIVLLKEVDAEGGFLFYTNYEGRKGRELQLNPRAALCFWWPSRARQVRLEGPVERVPAEVSDEYFASRPRGAQVGAWASAQSQPVADRDTLEAANQRMDERWGSGPVPRPPHWGGYRLVPQRIEFWQGRVSRLHDRLVFSRTPEGWSLQRLMP